MELLADSLILTLSSLSTSSAPFKSLLTSSFTLWRTFSNLVNSLQMRAFHFTLEAFLINLSNSEVTEEDVACREGPAIAGGSTMRARGAGTAGGAATARAAGGAGMTSSPAGRARRRSRVTSRGPSEILLMPLNSGGGVPFLNQMQTTFSRVSVACQRFLQSCRLLLPLPIILTSQYTAKSRSTVGDPDRSTFGHRVDPFRVRLSKTVEQCYQTLIQRLGTLTNSLKIRISVHACYIEGIKQRRSKPIEDAF
jgi:hypothetical protein